MMKLNLLCLVVSFIIGLAYMYIMKPYKKIIVKSPKSPEENDVYTTKDHKKCFRIKMEKTWDPR